MYITSKGSEKEGKLVVQLNVSFDRNYLTKEFIEMF